MKVWVVGSGTLIPNSERGSPAHWVQTGEVSLLMDCGPGTVRALAGMGLPWGAVSHLLLTHFHTDHTGDVAPLLFALRHGLGRRREDPLTILGPAGLRDHLAALADAHGSYVQDPGFPLAVQELSSRDPCQLTSEALRIRAQRTLHTENSLAIRLESPDGVLGYTGDTGPDADLGRFFQGCDILVAECSDPDATARENHLSPRTLAALATDARPRCLVTVHCYPNLDPEAVPSLVAAHGYGGWVVPGRDGLCMDLRGGTMELVGGQEPRARSGGPPKDSSRNR
jgi:ribonuclease BN (tRNA processing enzyme)